MPLDPPIGGVSGSDRPVKRLFLLRHAKSSWDDPGLDDHDRPLAPRGRRASKAMAEYLRRQGIAPQLVLCSSSTRTCETLERVFPQLGDEVAVSVEPGLYMASEGRLLDRLHDVPDQIETAMLIGHNPATQQLALSLAGDSPELERVRRKFPTAALATLEFEDNWRDLAPGAARLVAFVKPKELEG